MQLALGVLGIVGLLPAWILDHGLPRRLSPSAGWVLGDSCSSPVIYAKVVIFR
jgi:hypothetical protein